MDSIVLKLVFFCVIAALVVYFFWEGKKSQSALPSFDEYKAVHKQEGHPGATCYKCNSKNMRNLGVNGMHDDNRVVRCGHCDTALYQTQR